MDRAITLTKQSLDIMTLGDVFTQSGYFSDTRQAAQAVVKVLAGQELGLGPIASMTGIFIVKNRVTLSANAMAAVIKNSPRYDYRVKEHTPEKCLIAFFENSEVIGQSEFTMEDAKTAGLANADNWRKYPRNMLFARALSNGAKWYCADVFAGSPVYTPDELGAEIDGESGTIISVSDDAIIDDPFNDDPSEWLPGPVEFKEYIMRDFGTPQNQTYEDITVIWKEAGYTGFLSKNATEMYNCLAEHFAPKEEPQLEMEQA